MPTAGCLQYMHYRSVCTRGYGFCRRSRKWRQYCTYNTKPRRSMIQQREQHTTLSFEHRHPTELRCHLCRVQGTLVYRLFRQSIAKKTGEYNATVTTRTPGQQQGKAISTHRAHTPLPELRQLVERWMVVPKQRKHFKCFDHSPTRTSPVNTGSFRGTNTNLSTLFGPGVIPHVILFQSA